MLKLVVDVHLFLPSINVIFFLYMFFFFFRKNNYAYTKSHYCRVFFFVVKFESFENYTQP